MKISKILTQYGIITAACVLYAVGFNWCYEPNHLTVGGFTGIAQILNVIFPVLPIGTTVLVLNIPLFILSWRKVGRGMLFASLYATAVSSLMIDLLSSVYTFRPMDSILACLYGGVMIGVALGIMLRQSATTGGTEMAARLLKLKLERLSIGTLCLVIDFLVTFIYALIFRDLSRALYGIISLYVSTTLMDKVIYGPNAAKVAYIISERYQEITDRLLALERGVTLLDGTGAWSGKDRQVILCAFGRSHVIPIKKLVQQIDPDAFVIVCDAHEILGEGFGHYTPGGL